MAQGFGLLLGTLAMNPKTAQTIASIVVLAFTLVGGYFVKGRSSIILMYSLAPVYSLPSWSAYTLLYSHCSEWVSCGEVV